MDGIRIGGTFVIENHDPDWKLKWREIARNLVVNAGIYNLMDTGVLTATQVTAWFLGPTAASPSPAAADTMGGHGGWTEFTGYSQTVRQSWTSARTTNVISNASNLASFAINTTGTLGGAFVTDSSTKGGGVGTLFCCAANSGGNRSVSSGDTVTVRYSFSVADDGV